MVDATEKHTVDEKDTLFQQCFKLYQFLNQFNEKPYTEAELILFAQEQVAEYKQKNSCN